MQRLMIKKLSVATVYKIAFIGFSSTLVPFFMICGVLAMFDQATLKLNQDILTGVNALVAAPFMGFFAALALTLMVGSVLALGLWLFSKFKSLEIEIEPAGESKGKRTRDVFLAQASGNDESASD